MTSKYTNKNGVKLLAAIAVAAIMMAGAFIVICDDSDAAISGVGDFNNLNESELTGLGLKNISEDVETGAVTITSELATKYASGFYYEGNLTITVSSDFNINANQIGILVTGNLTIDGAKKLMITVSGERNTQDDLRAAGIIAGGNVSIQVSKIEVYCNATSTEASGAWSVGIANASTKTVEINSDCTQADIYGGNRGVQAYAGFTTSCAKTTIGGYEKAVRTGSAATNTVTVSGTGVLDCKLINGTGINKAGADDRFGIKAGKIAVADDAILKTQGLALNGTEFISGVVGKVAITGGYTQDAGAAKNIAGLYLSHASHGVAASNCVAVDTMPAVADMTKSMLYIVGDAQVYGVDIEGKSTTATTITSTVVAEVTSGISSAIGTESGAKNVTIPITSNIANTGEVSINTLSGKNVIVTLGDNTAAKLNVNLSSTETGTLTVTSLKTGTEYTFKIGDNTVVITGYSGDVTVSKGSVGLNISAAGSITPTFTITGDMDLYGTIKGTANVTLAKATTATKATADITNVRITATGAKLTITNVEVKSSMAVPNDGTIKFDTGSTIDGALYVQGGKIEGTITGGNLVLSNSVTLSNNLVIANGAVVTVSEGATLNGSGTYTLENNGTINVYGTVAASLSTYITNNNRIVVLSTSADLPDVIRGQGTIDSSAVASEGTISGIWKTTTTYTEYQSVTIVGDTTLESGTQIVIKGTITINDGVTLTIEDGAQLALLNSRAIMFNNGTIIIESDVNYSTGPSGGTNTGYGGLFVSGSKIENEGSIVISGDESTNNYVTIAANSLFYNEGTFSIDEDNKVTNSGSFYNKVDGNVNVNGEFSGTILNAGTVNLDGKTTQITQTADGAIINVLSTDGITITDSGFIKYGTNNISGDANQIVLTKSGNVTDAGSFVVKTNVVKPTTDGGSYKKEMVISGSIAASYTPGVANPTGSMDIAVTGTVKVKDTLTLASNVTISGSSATLDVSGSVTAEDGANVDIATLTVTGSVTVGKSAVDSTTVNGAMYMVTDTTTAAKTYYYTTLAKAIDGAIAADVKTITVTGSNTVKSDITIPAGITVRQNSGTITVKSDATLTVAEGAAINQSSGATIGVDGTLYVADKKSGINKNASVTSQVKAEGEKDVRYTNLNSAIAAAGSDPITIELNGDVTITTDSTIPENVTVDMNDKQFKVKGATLTIDGTLYVDNNAKYTVENGSAPLNTVGKIVLNGYIISDVILSYNAETAKTPAGAYYMVGTKYIITNANNADDVIGTAENNSVTLNGKNTVTDLTFDGTSSTPYTLRVSGDLDAGKITLSYTTVIIDNGKNIRAQITNTDGTVSLNDAVTGAETKFVASEKDGSKTLTVSGNIAAQTDKKKTYSAVFDGNILVKNLTMVTPTEGTTGTANYKTYYALVVDGNVDVISGTNSLGFILVNGTLTADNAAQFTADKIDVLGSLVAAAPTESALAGSITVNKSLIVGAQESGLKTIPMDIATTGDASVSGSVRYGVLYVIEGATVDKTLTDTIPSTKYYVEDIVWMTAYQGTLNTLIKDVTKAPVKDAYASGKWLKDLSKSDSEPTENVGQVDAVYAVIQYDIYSVKVIGDNGIGTISIDGNLLVKGSETNGENVFVLPGDIQLKAGNHEINYELKDGYTGTIKIKVDGKEISGKTFTLSGTDDIKVNASGIASVNVIIDVSGSVQKDPVTPTPEPTPVEPTKDDSMGITEYLLIVLVILAAILVVVVAIRMMRS